MILFGCADSTLRTDATCSCISSKASVVVDSVASIVTDIMSRGTVNGFPSDFTRSCDSTEYTYKSWFYFHANDSSVRMEGPAFRVRVRRTKTVLSYITSANGQLFVVDTMRPWFNTSGIDDSDYCLHGVERDVVDSIDQRILDALLNSIQHPNASTSLIGASCDTIRAALVLSDFAKLADFKFDVSGKLTGSQLLLNTTADSGTPFSRHTWDWCEGPGP